MKESCILTIGGNLLRFHVHLERWYFQTPAGSFIREAAAAEAEHICQNGLACEIEFTNPHPDELPRWRYLITIPVYRDLSKFKAETGCNGGDYAHFEHQDWYVAQVNGKTIFRFVTRHSSSSEFGYDELKAKFSQDLGKLHTTNVVGDSTYYSTECQYWDDDTQSVIYDDFCVLEQISEIANFDILWNAKCYTIIDEDTKYTDVLSISEKKKLISTLKSLGINLRDGYRRGLNRRGKKAWIPQR